MVKQKSEYAAKFKDPRWQKKRLEILQRDEFACQICGDAESTLHIHHRRYIYKREPWDYPNGLLVTLCVTCHEVETETLNENFNVLKEMLLDKFFAADLLEIASGIRSLEIRYESSVTARIINWALGNKEMMDEIFKRSFLSTKEHIEKRVKHGS